MKKKNIFEMSYQGYEFNLLVVMAKGVATVVMVGIVMALIVLIGG